MSLANPDHFFFLSTGAGKGMRLTFPWCSPEIITAKFVRGNRGRGRGVGPSQQSRRLQLVDIVRTRAYAGARGRTSYNCIERAALATNERVDPSQEDYQPYFLRRQIGT